MLYNISSSPELLYNIQVWLYNIQDGYITHPNLPDESLRSHYAAITQPLRNHYAAITQCLRNHYAAFMHRLRNRYAIITQRLRNSITQHYAIHYAIPFTQFPYAIILRNYFTQKF